MWARGRMAGWILGKRMLRWSLGCGMLHGMNSWERKVRRQDGAREETELRCLLSQLRLAGWGAPERRQPVTGSLVGLTLLGLPPAPSPAQRLDVEACGRQPGLPAHAFLTRGASPRADPGLPASWLPGRRLPRTGNIQAQT